MNLNKKMDEIQKEFFELYNKLYNNLLTLKPNDLGGKSFWSSSSMFDLIPLRVERSWGNLIKEDILNNRPNHSGRISEAIYENNFLKSIKYWHDKELTGFANFEKIDNNIIKEIRITADDDEQELVRIGYFNFENNQNNKSFCAHLHGVIQEEYKYKSDRITNIHINERTSIDYIYELPDGIVDKPIRTVGFKVEYDNEELSAIY